jgi:hypothetical protein
VSRGKRKKEKPVEKISEIDAQPLSKELKSAGPTSSEKVYETNPLTCP